MTFQGWALAYVQLLVGVMLAAIGFLFTDSRLNRRAREDTTKIDERNRRFDESARAKALRLNAYIHRQMGCKGTTGDAMAGSATDATVIPFPAIERETRPHPASRLAVAGDQVNVHQLRPDRRSGSTRPRCAWSEQ